MLALEVNPYINPETELPGFKITVEDKHRGVAGEWLVPVDHAFLDAMEAIGGRAKFTLPIEEGPLRALQWS